MTDPFTRSSPTYINAMRTCQRTGSALEVTDSKDWSLLALGALIAIVGIALIAWVG